MLEVSNLTVKYQEVVAVNEVSFSLKRGKSLGVVGESGSGKSSLALALMGLIPFSGEVKIEHDHRLAMIFQNPMTALNPVLTVGEQVAEVLRFHERLSHFQALERVIELFSLVKISNARERVHNFPHQFSGGMRQRVLIAMALALKPEMLIADEPTTALDVTIQAEIIKLILELKEKLGMGLIFISHDLPLVAQVATQLLVMKNGRVVEKGDVKKVFQNPQNDYTKRLLGALNAFA